MSRSVSEAMKVAKKLAKQGRMNPVSATKKQRSLVHQSAQAMKETLEGKQ